MQTALRTRRELSLSLSLMITVADMRPDLYLSFEKVPHIHVMSSTYKAGLAHDSSIQYKAGTTCLHLIWKRGSELMSFHFRL